MDEASVKVAVRVRPLSGKEQAAKCNDCVTVMGSNPPQIILDSTRAYSYDYCFSTTSTQPQIYDNAVVPLLSKFYEGYNATILAYGQTSSGKTYTMGTGLETLILQSQSLDANGLDCDDGLDSVGVVPRAIRSVFEYISDRQSKDTSYSFKMSVCFLELYNEELIDLLSPQTRLLSANGGGNSKKVGSLLNIREDGQGGIYWAGVKEEFVTSADQVFQCLHKGSVCRTTGSTDMNLTSSRSHAIFSITLQQEFIPQSQSGDSVQQSGDQSNLLQDQQQKTRLSSKFHFVDLAGSERMKKTKATGDRAKEGIAINSGLLAMGKVIHALNDRSSHVPYRDSKLTRLLQDSLGGNSQTLMIACISPADSNFGETLNTLNYASRARNIKNRVMVNQDYQAMEVHQLRAEVARLKIELMSLKGSQRLPSSSDLVTQSQNVSDVQTINDRQLSIIQSRLNNAQDILSAIQKQSQSFEDENLSSQFVKLQAELNALQSLLQFGGQQKSSLSAYPSSKSLPNAKVLETIDKVKEEIKREQQLVQQNKKQIGSMSPKASQSDIGVSEMDSDAENSHLDAFESTENEDKMLRMLDQIETDISIKEELVHQLESTQQEYDHMRESYEKKIAMLQDSMVSVERERDEALKKADSSGDKAQYGIIRQRYEEKVRKLQMEIGDYRKRYQDTQRELLRKREQNESVIRNLKTSLQSMKQDKVRMIKTLRQKESKIKEQEQLKDREIQILKRKERQLTEQTKKLESSNQSQKALLKKRTEESIQLQGKLRQFLNKAKTTISPLSKRFWSPKRSKTMVRSKRESSDVSTTSSATAAVDNTKKSWKSLLGIANDENALDSITEQEVSTNVAQKKDLFDKEVEQYLNSRMVNEVVEDLLSKRESLVKERNDLEAEYGQLNLQILSLGVNDPNAEFVTQQLGEIQNRMDIVDAEINYFSNRIKSAQMEIAQGSDMDGDVSADIVQSYENAVNVVHSVNPMESVRFMELLLDDVINMKLENRNRSLQIQQFEKENDHLKRTVNALKTTALETTLKSEVMLAHSRRVSAGNKRNTLEEFQADFDAIEFALGKTPARVRKPTASTAANMRRRSWSSDSPFTNGIDDDDDDDGAEQFKPSMADQSKAERESSADEAHNQSAYYDSYKDVFERLHREQTIASQAKVKELQQQMMLHSGDNHNVNTNNFGLHKREEGDDGSQVDGATLLDK
ncbi:hypothetical protein MP228_011510 [Amoeboaphelidium protococcarum]|nr:hypothetical protein MP228_011510 [Amoeboaphelidium protococcarum]